jgi:hypothetical protein
LPAGAAASDADREYACDRQSKIGKLDSGRGGGEGWTVVDTKRGWKMIFPPRMKE